MKAKLEFDLTDQEDKLRHTRVILADNAFSAMWEITQYLRNKIREAERLDIDNNSYEVIRNVQSSIQEILEENGIDLYQQYD